MISKMSTLLPLGKIYMFCMHIRNRVYVELHYSCFFVTKRLVLFFLCVLSFLLS